MSEMNTDNKKDIDKSEEVPAAKGSDILMDPGKRIIKHTEKGEQNFKDMCDKHFRKLSSVEKEINIGLSKDINSYALPKLSKIDSEIAKYFDEYSVLSNDFLNFLSRTNTKESADMQSKHSEMMMDCSQRVQKMRSTITHLIKKLKGDQCDKSVKSSSTKRSRSSSHTSSASYDTFLDKKIKAGAARAKVRFIKKETEIKHSQALLDAEMQELNAFKDLPVCEAELAAVEESESDVDKNSVHPEEGVENYLKTTSSNISMNPNAPAFYRNAMFAQPFSHISQPHHSVVNDNNVPVHQGDTTVAPPPSTTIYAQRDSTQNASHQNENSHGEFSEFARLWFKKDLITKCDQFDDKPEHYLAWKTSFVRVVRELCINSQEEMDLLIKWLGPSSCIEARNIRACYTHNPLEGRRKIWDRLEERYGAPSLVEASVRRKLDEFKPLKALKSDNKFKVLLSYYDSAKGVSPIVAKLPRRIQDKWTSRAFGYKQQHKEVAFPPFSFFLSFVTEMATMCNDPNFVYERVQNSHNNNNPVFAKKTQVSNESDNKSSPVSEMDPAKKCPLHNMNHSLNACHKFRRWRLDSRRAFIRKHKICFKCCASCDHKAENCKMFSNCTVCDSDLHATAMHLYLPSKNGRQQSSEDTQAHGGERTTTQLCTTICGSTFKGRSCAKLVPLNVYPNGHLESVVTVYAIIDDQSDQTLARSELIDKLRVDSELVTYRLKSCSGESELSGRTVKDLVIQSMDGTFVYNLPPVIECDRIPNNTAEIPTPEAANAHDHLKPIAHELHPLRTDIDIQLLLGRDVIDVHHIHDQIIGPPGSPFAQRLSLGWVIIGEVCLDGRHRPKEFNVLKTHVMENGRGTIFEPCDNSLHVKVVKTQTPTDLSFKGDNVFYTDRNDNKTGTSVEDREFVTLMDKGFRKGKDGKWTAPLPFKNPRQYLPDNRAQVYNRALSLDASLKRNPEKLHKMLDFMDGIFKNRAAERAEPIKDGHEACYIPIFGVLHPKKPEKIRGVFDSSIVYRGCSLNDSLLSGPNLTNSLLGILLRFRRDQYAIAADIQLMFYQFHVDKKHRDYLRFYWYENNDPNRPMVDFRMTVHVFGNRPSPAVATYGLRRAVQNADPDVVEFVNNEFYVDDALVSRPTADAAIDLVKRTRTVLLTEGGIRLHKIVSNDQSVMAAFPPEELGKDISSLSIDEDKTLVQHSLGLSWNLKSDSFIFTVPENEVTFTRRGILSKVNSIFDPIGMLAPITIAGKALLREICPQGVDWDEPISDQFRDRWTSWVHSLEDLRTVQIPRMYLNSSLSLLQDPRILVFSDASEKAIAAVAYVKMDDQLGFIMGKAKLAPPFGHSVPRLELCGAVLATEIGEFVSDHLKFAPSSIYYYTDSRVVLGYIANRTRRFYTYVRNSVSRILAVSSSTQWKYVTSELNPADNATRNYSREKLETWLEGPRYLCEIAGNSDENFPLVNPDEDKEIRHTATVLKAEVVPHFASMVDRFSVFSSWSNLVNVISMLRHIASSFHSSNDCSGWHYGCRAVTSPTFKKATENLIFRLVQQEAFSKELEALKKGSKLPKDSCHLSLSPYLDSDDIMRVGGRLNQMKDMVGLASLNPVILPKGHLATLIIRHYHSLKGSHQGRTITEGVLRSEGFWIIGAKRLISSVINQCIVCRRLRGQPHEQKMADLPLDRLTPGPPFSSVGMDVFGPWSVVTRRTRGGSAQSKRWAVLFTCLASRAVHVEVLEDMSTSCFINALRRFIALRGPVQLFRSDRGSNFIGAVDHLRVHAVNVEDKGLQSYLQDNGARWLFNAPHASHMGGVWERAIGSATKGRK